MMFRPIIIYIFVLLGLIFGLSMYARAHNQHFTDEENEWLNRQRAEDGTKCCDRHDTHVGVDHVTWRHRNGHYEVRIKGNWHQVPPGRLYRHKADDPSPWPGEALLFYSDYGTTIHLWCFSPPSLF